MSDQYWSVPEALAWIATRSTALVHELTAHYSTTPRDFGTLAGIARYLAPMSAHLQLSGGSAMVVDPLPAGRELERACSDGRIEMTGRFQNKGVWRAIPRDQWPGLELGDRNAQEIVARPVTAGSRNSWWGGLRLPVDRATAVWPALSSTVSLRRAVEIVCEVGRVDSRDACHALQRAFSLRLLVASGWTEAHVRAAVVYPDRPSEPKVRVPQQVWSGEWTISWSDSKLIRAPTPPGEPDEYHAVEVDETRLRSWIRDHLNWPVTGADVSGGDRATNGGPLGIPGAVRSKRAPGGKLTKRSAVEAWIAAKYPERLPPDMKNDVLVQDLAKDGIIVSERTVRRAMGRL